MPRSSPSSAVLLVGLAALVAACGGTEAATTSVSGTVTTQTVTTTAASSTTTQSVTTSEAAVTTTTAGSGMEIVQNGNVPFLTRATGLLPGEVDVYSPKQGGPWPVVVMLHGGGLQRWWYTKWATAVATRGAVVFVPEWMSTEAGSWDLTPKEWQATTVGQLYGDVAAAVRFARATAAQYGGDPQNVTLFGHSAGAQQAVMEAFTGAPASLGALAGAGSTIPDSLVLFDGDYVIGDPSTPWDKVVANDASAMKHWTPWSYLGQRVDFPITLIASGDPSLTREFGDPWAKDSWLAARDPSGDIRRGLEKLGALKTDLYNAESAQQLLAERLKADGDTVTYVGLTDSKHMQLGPKGMESLLDALVPKTQP